MLRLGSNCAWSIRAAVAAWLAFPNTISARCASSVPASLAENPALPSRTIESADPYPAATSACISLTRGVTLATRCHFWSEAVSPATSVIPVTAAGLLARYLPTSVWSRTKSGLFVKNCTRSLVAAAGLCAKSCAEPAVWGAAKELASRAASTAVGSASSTVRSSVTAKLHCRSSVVLPGTSDGSAAPESMSFQA